MFVLLIAALHAVPILAAAVIFRSRLAVVVAAIACAVVAVTLGGARYGWLDLMVVVISTVAAWRVTSPTQRGTTHIRDQLVAVKDWITLAAALAIVGVVLYLPSSPPIDPGRPARQIQERSVLPMDDVTQGRPVAIQPSASRLGKTNSTDLAGRLVQTNPAEAVKISSPCTPAPRETVSIVCADSDVESLQVLYVQIRDRMIADEHISSDDQRDAALRARLDTCPDSPCYKHAVLLAIDDLRAGSR